MEDLKDFMSNVFSGILVLCAIIITGFVIRQEMFPPEPQPAIQQVVENWQQLDLNGQQIGSDNAPVQIVEFFDYQCPFCKSVQPSVKAVQQKYPDKVSVFYEHFPLSGHEHAFSAAVAAECAAKQNKFSQFHDLLFSTQDQIGKISFDSLANEADVTNIASFNECIEAEQTAPIVESGLDLARELGVDAIPAFIINGKLITGALSEQRLEGLVKNALE